MTGCYNLWDRGAGSITEWRQVYLPDWTEAVERKFPGTYNARRDSPGTTWREPFGYKHAFMVVDRFYEHVKRDRQDVVLEFVPQDQKPLLVARSPAQGDAPELFSFAAITDEPPPEVAIAGHYRCIIQIKPEYVDAWLNPDPKNQDGLQAIFDERPRPFYEHSLAAYASRAEPAQQLKMFCHASKRSEGRVNSDT